MWKKKFKAATRDLLNILKEIGKLLTAVHCPKEVAFMHYKGHNRDGSKVAESNQLADCQARKLTLKNPFTKDSFDLDKSC